MFHLRRSTMNEKNIKSPQWWREGFRVPKNLERYESVACKFCKKMYTESGFAFYWLSLAALVASPRQATNQKSSFPALYDSSSEERGAAASDILIGRQNLSGSRTAIELWAHLSAHLLSGQQWKCFPSYCLERKNRCSSIIASTRDQHQLGQLLFSSMPHHFSFEVAGVSKPRGRWAAEDT